MRLLPVISANIIKITMNNHKDLFGEDIKEDGIIKLHTGYCKRFKLKNNYRNSTQYNEKCKNCSKLLYKRYRGKNYYKCILIGDSLSSATDIRVNHVCDLFEPKNNGGKDEI